MSVLRPPNGFGRSEDEKERRLEAVRRRLAAATPPTKKRPLPTLPTDWRRTLMAGFLVLVFVLAIIAGSGVF